MLWDGEVDDAKSIDERIASPSTTGDSIRDFENLVSRLHARTQENPNRKFQETSHHSYRKSSIREEITYRQTDCLDDL